MGKIILNGTEYAGSGGSGGHTIVDPTGTDMPQENKLQFTGAVSVSDDSVNGQTVVNVEGGGNVYGAFIDPTRVVYSSFVFDSSAHTWTATEDCILTDNMLPPDSTTAYFIRIGGKQVFAGYNTVEDPFVYVKKGQVVEYRAKSGSTMKAYGVTQGTNGIFAPVIYSDTERVIGVWRDGKPLYQKTTHIGAISANVSSAFPVGIGANVVDTMVSYNVIATVSSGAWVNLPQPLPSNISNYASYVDNYNKADDTINIITGANRAFSDAFVTVQYTKTIDVAGSGSWTPSGANAVHYSFTEHIVGTWFGETLWEKTIAYVSSAGQADTDKVIDTSIRHGTNCYVVDLQGIQTYGYLRNNGTSPTPNATSDPEPLSQGTLYLPYYGGSSMNSAHIYLYSDGIHFKKRGGSANANSIILTVRYVKI